MKDFAIQIVDSNDAGNIMDIKIEPKYDAMGRITQGFVIGNTLNQNKALILMANAGEFKNAPTLGVGLADATLDHGNNLIGYRHKIRRNFALDGLKATKLELYDLSNVQIEAEYE